MQRNILLRRSTALVILALLFANAAFLVWYLFVGYQSWFHSDSAAKVLLAKEIVSTGQFFPSTWNFANGDLFVLFGHTFIFPLLSFMPAGFNAHAVAGLIFTGLILSGIWWLTGIPKISRIRRLVILTICASGISGLVAENLFGQVSYGAVVFFCCYLLVFAWRSLQGEGRVHLWQAALLVLATIAFWANPQRAIVAYGLPLICAAASLLFSPTDIQRSNIWKVLAVFGVGALAGALLHTLTIANVNNVLGAGHARWLSFDLMLRNLSLTLKGILAIFDGLPTPDGVLLSKSGLHEATRLLAAILAMLLMPVAVVKALKAENDGLRFIAAFAASAFMAVFFLQITTSLPDMSDPVQSARYLVPSLLLGLLVLLMSPVSLTRTPLISLGVAFIAAVLALSAFHSFRVATAGAMISWGMKGQLDPQRMRLVRFLADNGLQYGYATYWNAGVLSVLSDGKTLVRQVLIQDGIPLPMRHLASNRWYRPSAWQGTTFLLMTTQEASTLNWARLSDLGLNTSRTLSFDDYRIYVFDENIANRLSGWDTSYESPAHFLVSDHSPSQTGRLVKETEQHEAMLVAEKGESGALHYGPYVNVERGTYIATFDVEAAPSPSGAVRLDVSAAPDQKLYGQLLLSESYRPQEIVFTLDKTRTMEFRVWALGNAQVVFKGVTLRRVVDNP